MTATTDSTAPPDGKLLLTVEEAAHRLGIGRTVMYRLVSSGAVESVTLGRLRRVPSECLDEFVSSLRKSQARDTRIAGSVA
jgi:excisionase family DNA binding protein